MQKWEYKIIYFAMGENLESQWESQLNAMGDDGWELVSNMNSRCIFKRPKD